MQFKFVGQYTNGHTSITQHGVTFHGDAPEEVTDEEAIRLLSKNIEFKALGGPPNRAEERPAEQDKPTHAAQAMAVSELTRKEAEEQKAPEAKSVRRKRRKAKK